jgi:hypothetical protein
MEDQVSAAVGTPTNFMFGSANGVPYVYAGASVQVVGQPVTIGLDNVFAGTPSLPLSVGNFTVQPGSGGPFLPYQIVAAGAPNSGIWDFSANRTVRADFDNLLLRLEGQQLKNGRLALIRGWLAQALPQTFAETLYFRHGFDPANRFVDLTPGMRLRVDFESHQAVDPEASALNGFVGAGSTVLDVVQLPSAQYGVVTALDPFVSSLQGFAVPAPQGGAGGVADLRSVAAAPYWRLLYPQSFTSSDGVGAVGTQQNVVLVGATSWNALVEATASYLNNGTVPPPSMFFRGRAAAVPQLPVYLQGDRTFVTLGMTVRNLLSELGPVPWLSGGKVSFTANQTYGRTWTPLTGGNPPMWTVGGWGTVRFDGTGGGTYGTYGDNRDSFDLPVLAGDLLSLQMSS